MNSIIHATEDVTHIIDRTVKTELTLLQAQRLFSQLGSVCVFELRTLRTQDTSDPGHFGTSLVGPICPDRSALVPKCPKDSSDLNAELSCPKCQTVPSQVPNFLGPF